MRLILNHGPSSDAHKPAIAESSDCRLAAPDRLWGASEEEETGCR
jgi:hypothetical protein